MTDDRSGNAKPRSESPSSAKDGEARTGVFTILVPLDGSERAARALPIAEDFCQRLDGEIALLRVLPLTILPYAIPIENIPPEVYQEMVDDQKRMAEDYLGQVAIEARRRGLRAQTHIHYGDAAMAILDAIPALRPTMVIMTTHGRTGLARFTLGSVADRVARAGHVPVLLVRAFAAGERRGALRRALVPLDGSPLAEWALFTIALQLAGPVLREITLARIVDPRAGPGGIRAAEAYLDEVRRRLVERLGGHECAVTARVEVGAPAAGILAVAHEQAADLILMSARGEGGIGRLAFGSVTDRVLRDGDLPILLVCPPKGAHERPEPLE